MTPFNIGRAIDLQPLVAEDALPKWGALFPCNQNDAEKIIQTIFEWTNGQPFLSQRICGEVFKCLVRDESNTFQNQDVRAWVTEIIEQQVLNNWEINDKPVHLKTIRARLEATSQESSRSLEVYGQVLQKRQLIVDSSPEQLTLLLTGAVIVDKTAQALQVFNPIYTQIFHWQWVQEQLDKVRPFATALNAWVASGCDNSSLLLQGQALDDALKWASNRTLSREENHFLSASQSSATQVTRKDADAANKAKALLAAAREQAEQQLAEAQREIEQIQAEAERSLADVETKAKVAEQRADAAAKRRTWSIATLIVSVVSTIGVGGVAQERINLARQSALEANISAQTGQQAEQTALDQIRIAAQRRIEVETKTVQPEQDLGLLQQQQVEGDLAIAQQHEQPIDVHAPLLTDTNASTANNDNNDFGISRSSISSYSSSNIGAQERQMQFRGVDAADTSALDNSDRQVSRHNSDRWVLDSEPQKTDSVTLLGTTLNTGRGGDIVITGGSILAPRTTGGIDSEAINTGMGQTIIVDADPLQLPESNDSVIEASEVRVAGTPHAAPDNFQVTGDNYSGGNISVLGIAGTQHVDADTVQVAGSSSLGTEASRTLDSDDLSLIVDTSAVFLVGEASGYGTAGIINTGAITTETSDAGTKDQTDLGNRLHESNGNAGTIAISLLDHSTDADRITIADVIEVIESNEGVRGEVVGGNISIQGGAPFIEAIAIAGGGQTLSRQLPNQVPSLSQDGFAGSINLQSEQSDVGDRTDSSVDNLMLRGSEFAPIQLNRPRIESHALQADINVDGNINLPRPDSLFIRSGSISTDATNRLPGESNIDGRGGNVTFANFSTVGRSNVTANSDARAEGNVTIEVEEHFRPTRRNNIMMSPAPITSFISLVGIPTPEVDFTGRVAILSPEVDSFQVLELPDELVNIRKLIHPRCSLDAEQFVFTGWRDLHSNTLELLDGDRLWINTRDLPVFVNQVSDNPASESEKQLRKNETL